MVNSLPHGSLPFSAAQFGVVVHFWVGVREKGRWAVFVWVFFAPPTFGGCSLWLRLAVFEARVRAYEQAVLFWVFLDLGQARGCRAALFWASVSG
jgi:hypothetical protein